MAKPFQILKDKLAMKALQQASPTLYDEINNYRINVGEPMHFLVREVSKQLKPSLLAAEGDEELVVERLLLWRKIVTEFIGSNGHTYNATTELSFEIPCNPGQPLKPGDQVMLVVIPITEAEDVADSE